jgi:Fe-S-cluster containining protein
MDNDQKQAILREMFRIHDTFTAGLNLACRERCADCCTRNVTITTLEGMNIIQNLSPEEQDGFLEQLKQSKDGKRFHPAITVNEMADQCADGRELPEEQLNPDWGSCPLLDDGRCSIYSHRPFECRAFVSERKCSESGFADMSPLTINVNNLFRQYIEHIDAGGMSGNLTDVLLNLLDESGTGLLSNRPISVLMIDPEHQQKLEGIMEELNTIRV